MKLFTLSGISKKYALRAANYRRSARSQGVRGLDFSEASLRGLHAWESRGVGKVDKSKNGYAYGKWIVDLSVSMWVEDLRAGNVCKHEFLQTRIQKLHNEAKLQAVIPAPFFPHKIEFERREARSKK